MSNLSSTRTDKAPYTIVSGASKRLGFTPPNVISPFDWSASVVGVNEIPTMVLLISPDANAVSTTVGTMPDKDWLWETLQ